MVFIIDSVHMVFISLFEILRESSLQSRVGIWSKRSSVNFIYTCSSNFSKFVLDVEGILPLCCLEIILIKEDLLQYHLVLD